MPMIADIDLNAPVVVHRDIDIHAPLHRVWRLLTEVSTWPEWQPDIAAAAAPGPLTTGGRFHWTTAGLEVESIVYGFQAPHRILWGGSSQGIHSLHLWTFEVHGSSVRARTEESWDGAPVLTDVDGMRAALGESLTAWLGHLKRAAERS